MCRDRGKPGPWAFTDLVYAPGRTRQRGTVADSNVPAPPPQVFFSAAPSTPHRHTPQTRLRCIRPVITKPGSAVLRQSHKQTLEHTCRISVQSCLIESWSSNIHAASRNPHNPRPSAHKPHAAKSSRIKRPPSPSAPSHRKHLPSTKPLTSFTADVETITRTRSPCVSQTFIPRTPSKP